MGALAPLAKPISPALGGAAGEGVRMDRALHRQMVAGGYQVLADGQHLEPCRGGA
ncbi:MAG: hypothetical protein AW06_001776 [Candidatus Accumulibacter cognatus]|uniref:Uncharacterized protein n=1 Tax=Candidatus Accumulibacter cognatus TaxID=2954383 RepID=A0A080M9K5_9PROT|nr:MAG: hypothetical protein AW06_001776 [Candidatus Accumulibacter cognatus]